MVDQRSGEEREYKRGQKGRKERKRGERIGREEKRRGRKVKNGRVEEMERPSPPFLKFLH